MLIEDALHVLSVRLLQVGRLELTAYASICQCFGTCSVLHCTCQERVECTVVI